MGTVEQEALERANADQMARHGEMVLYVPASGADPFECLATMASYLYDESGTGIVRDACERSVLHSDLAEHGISMPTIQLERQPGDAIRITSPTGAVEDWVVVKADYEYGMWVLGLERNIRGAP